MTHGFNLVFLPLPILYAMARQGWITIYLHHIFHVVEPSSRCYSEGFPAPEDSLCYKVLVALRSF